MLYFQCFTAYYFSLVKCCVITDVSWFVLRQILYIIVCHNKNDILWFAMTNIMVCVMTNMICYG